MNIEGGSTTFTPVRRQESSLNHRRLLGNGEKDWTTARCHRLLRALTSRVAVLKREIDRLPTNIQNANEQEKSKPKKRNLSSSAGDDEEPWTQAKKKIKRKYSSKGLKNGHGQKSSTQGPRNTQLRKALVPGEVLIPTPILARVRGETPEAESSQGSEGDEDYPKPRRTWPTLNNAEPHFQSSENLRDIRQKVPAARYTVYEGIFHGLEGLLRATAKDERDTRPIKKTSLMAMVLRAVPAYIAQQEALLKAHMAETGSKSAIENRDMSTEIYDELEDFGTSGHGWKNLRIVVRSHGIQVIEDAIRAGLVDVEFCAILIAFCFNTAAPEEAQSLLSSLLLSTKFAKPRTLYDTPGRPLVILLRILDHPGRLSFQYRTLSLLLSKGLLPVEWLATKEFGPVWTSIVQSLAPGYINPEALGFLNTALPLLSIAGNNEDLSRKPLNGISGATKNTFSSILTILASIVILSRGAVISSCSNDITQPSTEYRHITKVLRSSLIEHNSYEEGSSIEGSLLLLSNLVLSTEYDEYLHKELQQLVSQLRQRQKNEVSSVLYNEVVSFMCRVACCCGKGASTTGFEHLKHMHGLIEQLWRDENGNILQGLIVDSAFAFAQLAPGHEHLEYATSMDTRYDSRGFDVEDGIDTALDEEDELQRGFRWEEGIGEWVAATPGLSREQKTSQAKAFANAKEVDTPYRPRPQRTFRDQSEDLLGEAENSSSDQSLEDSMQVDETVATSPDSASEHQANLEEEVNEISSSSPESEPSKSGDELGEESQESIVIDSAVEEFSLDVSFDVEEISFSSSQLSMPSQNTRPATRQNVQKTPRLNRKLFSNNPDWYLSNDSSSTSSTPSDSETSTANARLSYIDRAPRLGRRALRSSHHSFQLFEDDGSDDELSIMSTTTSSSQERASSALKDVTKSNAVKNVSRRRIQPRTTRSKASKVLVMEANEDSEDELCI